MRVIVCENYEEMSLKAAKIVAGQVMLKPDSILGLATGSTPIGMYDNLVKMYEAGELDFSNVTSFNLDEYYPIEKSNRQSYYYFMNEHLFSKININPYNTNIPNGETENPEEECERYEKAIQASGGIDLQILGIGKNGHIGFNEPDACLDSYTHLTDLTENTIQANSRFFTEDEIIPTKALTMGISTILKAKKIILLANGAGKSRVVAELLNDKINTSIPATMLKTHPDVILICDKDAYMGARLGVDIGKKDIRFAVVNGGKKQYTSSIKTSGTTSEEILNDIVNEANRIKEMFPIKTLGIGTPGVIKDGLVTTLNLPFKELAIEEELGKRLNLPATADNDANCAALGEVQFGAANDCENIVLVKLGTGIGGGIVMDRQICHGSTSLGEVGHIIIQAVDGLPCPCGLKGCWEQYASVTAFVRQAKEAALDSKTSALYNVLDKKGDLTADDIFEAVESGCSVAKDVFDKYIHYLAAGIDSLVNVFGPDAVVLAGEITKHGDKLLNPLKEKIHANVRVEISTLQTEAGALGAALL